MAEEKKSRQFSDEEMDAIIEKCRAVEDVGELGSERVYGLVKRYFSPTVVGLEHLPERPTLFAGNHSAFGLDGFILMPTLYYETGRFVRAMGDNAWLALDVVGARFSASLEVTRINEDIAGRLIDGTAGKIGNAESAIDGIRLAEQRGRLEQITERRDYFSRVLTSLSLAFEASRNLTSYVANGAVLPQQTDRGSILDILR